MPKDLSTLNQLSSSQDDEPDVGSRRRRPLPSWLLPIGLLAGFVMVLALLFGSRLLPATPVKVAPVITVRSEQAVELVDSEATIDNSPSTGSNSNKAQLLFQATGWIEPDPFPISVSTLVGGIVDEVYILEGDSVKKGQKLAKLIDEDAILDLEEAEADVDVLKSEIEASIAKIDVVESRRSGTVSNIDTEKGRLAELKDRYNRLNSLPRGSIPQIDLTAAKLQVAQQQGRLDKASSDITGVDSEIIMVQKDIMAKQSALRRAEVSVAKAKLALKRHLITSPMDGTVLLLHAAPGRKRLIQMDDAKSAYIVELFNPAKLQARIDVPLSEARSLSVGQPVEMICDLLPSLILKGTVSRITGEADLQRNTLQVKVQVNNPDSRLRPEMLVRGKFYPIPQAAKPIDSPKNQTQKSLDGRLSIFVPQAAIHDRNKVWVATNRMVAEMRTLTLGKEVRDGHQIAVDGVRSGERVILPPHTKLKPGARVKIIP